MKQLYLKCLFIGFLSIVSLKTVAYSCYVGGIFYNLYTNKTAEVTYYSSSNNSSAYDGSVGIPSTVTYNKTTYNVTSIGYYAFKNCTKLQSVIIPNSVTSIKTEAFKNCSGLKYVTIGNSVKEIGSEAFDGCSNLLSITIPNSVTNIGKEAFDLCSKLESIVVDSDNTVYDSRNGCNAIIETATNKLLKGCNKSTIPNGVITITESSFYGCSGLTSVNIPNSVTTIGNSAFYGCSGLTSVTIGNGVTSIGNWGFQNCYKLTSVKIPKSVTSIGSLTFDGCSGLESIVVDSDNTVYDSRNGCNAIIETATNKLLKGCNKSTIPNGVTSILGSAFQNCRSLASVKIPNSVITIESSAFKGCSGLTSVTIPNSVTKIGSYGFQDCSGLTSVTIGNGVTTIENFAFSGCNGLTSINIPNSVTTIEQGTFANCTGLTSVTIPRSVTNIGIRAFSGCSGLTSVTIPNSVTEIGSDAFEKCYGLTSITIPNSVTRIGSGSFSGCSCFVICKRETPPTASNNTFNEKMKAIVPNSFVSAYKNATGWNKMSINPLCFLGKTTQSTITLCSYNLMSNVKAVVNGFSFYSKNDSIKITGLDPNTTYTISLSGDVGDIHLENQISVTTKNINFGIQLVKRTNLTLKLKGYVSDSGDAVIASSGFEGYEGQNDLYIDKLKPGYSYSYTYFIITASGKKLSSSKSFQTLPITLNISAKTSSSSANLTGSHDVVDATITSYGFDNYPNQTQLKFTGLDPNKSYNQTFYVVTKEGDKVTKQVTYTTESLTLTTSQPKVISAGNVIVAAESNLDDEETNVGFEWRRNDWTTDFASNTGTAYLYNGTMEGYIRSLNTEKLWKFRPYYTSNTGNTYYGEWVGIDPTNTSYFEPTVHTYANVSVNDNSAEVKGYVQRGTDNVVSKGFAYWNQSQGMEAKEANSAAPSKISSVPSYAKTVEVSGSQQVMTASISDLEYETTYCYVAFVTTSDGETFYGDVCSFTTGADLLGIENVEVSSHEPAIEVARYNINGHRISLPQRGINIIRMSDGTTRKVIVK